MKIFTRMKSLALMATMLFTSSAMFALDVTTTAGGQLAEKIDPSVKLTTTELSVTGPLNGADILYIREMAGVGYESSSTTDGKLISLNLKNASIVDGGEYYKNQMCIANTIGKYMFNKCKNITTLVLPDGITEIAASAMATDGPSVTELNIPASVANIGASAFGGLKALTKVTFSEGSVLKTIGNSAFSISSGVLADITLPNSVESIGNSVFTYSKLTKFTFPTSLKSIGNLVFQNVETLTEISEIPASLEVFGDNVFQGTSIAAVTVNSGSNNFTVEKKVLYNKDKTIVYWLPSKSDQTTVVLPATVTEIKGSAFFGCENLNLISLPQGLTTIGGAAFKQSGITAITLPASLTTLNGTSQFEKCEHLEYFCMKGTMEKLTSMMLQNCPKLDVLVFENATAPHFYKKSIDGCADNVTLYAPEASLDAYKSAMQTADAGSGTPGPATDKTVTYAALDKLPLYDFMNNNIGHAIGTGSSTDGNLAGESIKKGDVTFTCTDGLTPTRYFYVASRGNELQLYKNGSFTLTADEGKVIKSVNITFGNSQTGLTADSGTYADGTWSGSAKSVTFSTTGSRYIYTIAFETADETSGIEAVNAGSAKAAAGVKKYVKDGRLVIENARGIFTVAGAQVK